MRNRFLNLEILMLIPILIVALSYAAGAAERCENLFRPGAIDVQITGKNNKSSEPTEGVRKDLYPKGKSHPKYGELLKAVKAGDTLDFGRGDIFQVREILGEGDTTLVVETTEGLVLRIPKALPRFLKDNPENKDDQVGGERFINAFVRLQKELSEAGVPVVGIDLVRSRAPRFLVVEKINIRFRLDQIFNTEGKKNIEISAIERKLALEALIEFAKTTWSFRDIGDFRADQIGYDGQKWILFDFSDYNRKISSFSEEKNIFSPVNNKDSYGTTTLKMISDNVYEILKNEIDKERNAQKSSGLWFERNVTSGAFAPRIIIKAVALVEDLVGTKLQIESWQNNHGAGGKPNKKNEAIAVKILGIREQTPTSIVYDVSVKDEGEGILEIVLKVNADGGYRSGKAGFTLNWWGQEGYRHLANGDDYILLKKKKSTE